MKQTLTITLLVLLGLSLIYSCNDEPDGRWDDNILLSDKEVVFSVEASSIIIATGGTGWWIESLGLDDEALDFEGIDTTDPDFLIEADEFTVERRNATNIHISMTENQTGEERMLWIALQAGNYFDAITITQAGN